MTDTTRNDELNAPLRPSISDVRAIWRAWYSGTISTDDAHCLLRDAPWALEAFNELVRNTPSRNKEEQTDA